jgi:hypothetical protein
MRRALFLLPLVLPLLGFTNCQYFSSTTVPASDTTVPIAVPSLMMDGEQQIRFGSLSITTNELKDFFAIAAIYDTGGARSVVMNQGMTIECSGRGLTQRIVQDFSNPPTDRQRGGPGSTVSNGIYVWSYIDFAAQARLCDPGFTVSRITYGWNFSGDDFFGNQASGSGSVTYVR